jgi:tetratricopeptide (TPR) repeat protein
LPYIQESIRTDPANAWAHRSLGIYHLQGKKPKEALTEFRQAEKLDATVEQLYYYIGLAESGTGSKTGACEAWKRGELAGDELARKAYSDQCK